MLPVPLMIHPNHRLLRMWMELLAPSKLNLLPSLLEQSSGPTSTAAPSSTAPSSTPPQTQVSDVNAVQSTPSQQLGGKKKARNKPKKNNNNEQPKTQPQTPAAGKQPQRKLKFPCLICGDDHYTRDCPHRDEVAKLFKGNSQPVVLTQPFP
jgi:hypothetical protein